MTEVLEYRVFRHFDSKDSKNHVRLHRFLNSLSIKGWRLEHTIGCEHALMVRTVPKCWLDNVWEAGLSTRGANVLEDHFGFFSGVVTLSEVADEGHTAVSKIRGFGKPQFEILDAAFKERLMDFE